MNIVSAVISWYNKLQTTSLGKKNNKRKLTKKDYKVYGITIIVRAEVHTHRNREGFGRHRVATGVKYQKSDESPRDWHKSVMHFMLTR